jgi:hypothetical protein
MVMIQPMKGLIRPRFGGAGSAGSGAVAAAVVDVASLSASITVQRYIDRGLLGPRPRPSGR